MLASNVPMYVSVWDGHSTRDSVQLVLLVDDVSAVLRGRDHLHLQLCSVVRALSLSLRAECRLGADRTRSGRPSHWLTPVEAAPQCLLYTFCICHLRFQPCPINKKS